MLTASQCRAARALLDITQQALAEAAGVSESTIVDLEKQRRDLSTAKQQAVRHALERAGAVFIDENGGGAGVRLAKGRIGPRSTKQRG